MNDKPVELYRPSNGTEGDYFQERWCDRCEKDRGMRDDDGDGNGCPIIARALVYKLSDPEYPREWVRDGPLAGQAHCTAFVLDKSITQ